MKKIVALGFILLLVFSVFSREDNSEQVNDQILFEKAEEYLNTMCGLTRLFLNAVVRKLNLSGGSYVLLNEDTLVMLYLAGNLGLNLDQTDINNPIIYVSSGYLLFLENEAELVAGIAHELAHIAYSYDRYYEDSTEDEYLKSESTVDRIAILVLKEMGYKPEALANFFSRILYKYQNGELKLIRPESTLASRSLLAKELANEIYNLEPKKNQEKYKEYLYFTETEFKELKKIVKYLHNKKGGN